MNGQIYSVKSIALLPLRKSYLDRSDLYADRIVQLQHKAVDVIHCHTR
jgi:hypothetical protein